VALGFVALELEDYEGCCRHCKRNAESRSLAPRPFLTEDATALKARKGTYTKNSLSKGLLIQDCEDVFLSERRAVIDDLLYRESDVIGAQLYS